MKNSRELVIHAGLPKTATTAIQDNLYLNHKALLENYGIDYCPELCLLADVNCTGHHPMAWGKFHREHPHFKELDDNYIAEQLSVRERVLLSSEWFIYAQKNMLTKALSEWDLPERRKVVLVQRNEFDFVRSRWLQSIKMGQSFLSFQDFYYKLYKPHRASVSKMSAVWKECGFEVQILSYDDLKGKNKDITRAFIDIVYDIDIGEKGWREKSGSNISPKPQSVNSYREIMTIINDELNIDLLDNKTIPANKYKNVHDKICLILSQQTLLDDDLEIVRKDIESLTPYNK